MAEKLLFVDDDHNVLAAIKRMLFGEPYEQFYSSSAREALELIKKCPVDVIVSDMRMPEMDGIAFLEKSIEILPEAIRIILSGQADMYSVMEAINRGGIWRFISKPWNDEDMKCTIHNAFDLYAIRRERSLLLEELAEKNKELELINRELEKRVLQRTAIIEAQKRLLHLMIDGMDLQSFAFSSCKEIAQLTESNQVTLLHAVGKPSQTFACHTPSEAQCLLLNRILSEGKQEVENGYIGVPVVYSNTVVGALGVATASDVITERINEILTSLVPIIALALGQFKMILEAPHLMEVLDDIIKKI